MSTFTIHEAKTHLSKLVAAALAGEEVIVARGKVPVVKLVPVVPTQKPRRVPGQLAHMRPPGSRDILDDGFWDPLSDEDMGLTEEQLNRP